MTNSASSKPDLRMALIAQRDALPADFVNTSRWKVWNNLRSVIAEHNPGVIAFYSPIHNEIDLTRLAEEMAAEGRVVALPRSVQRGLPLIFNQWNPKQPKDFDTLGIPCGNGAEIMPNMVVLPLLGFMRNGNRLGYGGGFYDITLPELPAKTLRVGVAYAFQELQAMPIEAHDQPMDYVITEQEVILCQP